MSDKCLSREQLVFIFFSLFLVFVLVSCSQITRWMLKHYGDLRVVKTHYDSLVLFMDNLITHAKTSSKGGLPGKSGTKQEASEMIWHALQLQLKECQLVPFRFLYMGGLVRCGCEVHHYTRHGTCPCRFQLSPRCRCDGRYGRCRRQHLRRLEMERPRQNPSPGFPLPLLQQHGWCLRCV